jgi:hypothetical protein
MGLLRLAALGPLKWCMTAAQRFQATLHDEAHNASMTRRRHTWQRECFAASRGKKQGTHYGRVLVLATRSFDLITRHRRVQDITDR